MYRLFKNGCENWSKKKCLKYIFSENRKKTGPRSSKYWEWTTLGKGQRSDISNYGSVFGGKVPVFMPENEWKKTHTPKKTKTCPFHSSLFFCLVLRFWFCLFLFTLDVNEHLFVRIFATQVQFWSVPSCKLSCPACFYCYKIHVHFLFH